MDFTCPTFFRQVTLQAIIFSILVIINCAEVRPPPGGPEDKAAPFIVSSLPASGSIDVAPDNTISIFFSERIAKPEGKRAVFISPRPASEPRLTWKSDRLIINLADSFRVDQTYIVSLSTDIVDMRRNRLDKATTIAFSTGSTIDSGQISGVVMGAGKAAQGILVGLYDSAQLTGETPIDSIYAGYLTQTNDAGLFVFQHLPPKEFRLIAFEDRNRDERFDPEREQFAVPDRLIHTGDSLSLDSLNMTLTSQRPDSGAIGSASYTADKMIRVRLSSDIDLDRLIEAPSRVVVRPYSDTLTVLPGRAVIAGRERVGSEFSVYAGDLAEGAYILAVYLEEVKPGQGLRFDSLKVKSREDKNIPEMVFSPDSRPQFFQDLKMTAAFTEALDTSTFSRETFQLFDEEDRQLALKATWTDPLRVQFKSDDIVAGARYRLKITEFDIIDKSGNTMGDSLREYSVTTLNKDSLGTVAGRITVKLDDRRMAPVVLQFNKVENQQTFDLPVSGREFKIDLPAGKYLVNGFIDIDSSGLRDLGSAIPYRYSETVMTHPDTIAVRARFETAGVELKFK